jgi:hypothetical protein
MGASLFHKDGMLAMQDVDSFFLVLVLDCDLEDRTGALTEGESPVR